MGRSLLFAAIQKTALTLAALREIFLRFSWLLDGIAAVDDEVFAVDHRGGVASEE
jgi:hypothetical protein